MHQQAPLGAVYEYLWKVDTLFMHRFARFSVLNRVFNAQNVECSHEYFFSNCKREEAEGMQAGLVENNRRVVVRRIAVVHHTAVVHTLVAGYIVCHFVVG